MKFLYITDTHIRGDNPASRKDNFTESLLEKFKEIGNIIKEKNIDYLLHGGDIFERPDIALSVVNRFVNIIKTYNIPIFLIGGNHDMFGFNPKTLDRTILRLLSTVDLLKLLGEEIIILKKDGITMQLTGQDYINDIDKGNALEFYSPKIIEEGVDYSIHMVHGMLLDRPFIEGVNYTLIDDIKNTKADIILSGHYHTGFKTQIIDGKYFINPGALSRISSAKAEVNRRPKAVYIEFNKEDGIIVEDIFLKSPKSGKEILDTEKMERERRNKIKSSEFLRDLKTESDFKLMNIRSVMEEISNKEGIEKEVREEALRRMAIEDMGDN